MFALALALVIDRVVGDPDWLWRRAPHPVVWIGWVIDRVDNLRMRLPDRPEIQVASGCILLLLLAALALAVHFAVAWITGVVPLIGWTVHLAIVVVLLAQKSLHDHVDAVREALGRSIEDGRSAVAMIVGRDVTRLDETGVSAAAIESLAENASDGVVAPALWYAVGGVWGIVFYKMVNTADSMIGHRTPQHEYFGKAAARLDDVLNWPAARLLALLVLVRVTLADGLGRARHALRQTRADAPLHRSPNAGWPETAFATALGIRLGGPRSYGVNAPAGVWLNGSARLALRGDIDRALGLFRHCCTLLLGLVLLAAVLMHFG